jgi:uncharacterized protein (TIGR03790 family)
MPALIMDCARSFLIWLLVFFALAPLSLRAGGDEVVVIYNNSVPESRMVAEHYAAMRQVPATQIFGFALTTNEVIPRADFTDFLQKPLAQKLEDSGLWKFGEAQIAANGDIPAHTEERIVSSKIRYAVLCYGVPLKIPPASELDQLEDKIAKSDFRRDEASVDSELAWLPLIRMNVPLEGPLNNLLYGCTNPAALTPMNGILMVARLDGPSPEIANGLVDKAMAAERNGLWGRAYFDARGLQTNNSYYLGDHWMLTGAEICRQDGFDVEVDTNAETFPAWYPMSNIAVYAGWYDANVSGPFAQPAVEFMPGAFAYHLHSFSAETLRSRDSRWCGPLLARGAACTMGCVYEPYLQFTPNIALFLEAWFNGYTFGQAAWVSQDALSWQTTVIGDPLYQPFNQPPVKRHAQLARDKSPLIEWSFERLMNLDLVRGAPLSALEKFLENLPATAKSPVLTEKLADIYDRLGKPGSAIGAWQKALTLNPSPQQRLRMRLILEQKLLADGQKAEAIADDQSLLAEAPAYPGRARVEERLKTLTDPALPQKP